MTATNAGELGSAVEADDAPAKSQGTKSGLLWMSLSALGIVFGDIGTSPLYTFKTVLSLSHGEDPARSVMGLLSLIIWTLTIVTTLKYVALAMSVDNKGEGGILALMALVKAKSNHAATIAAVALLGAALLYGDGAITPAISVLSALEGLTMATDKVEPFILPAAVIILALLFAAQPLGTARISKTFGPIMALWFLCLAVLGIGGIRHHPQVLGAVDPRHAVWYLAHHGYAGFLVLGAAFLCVTGAEALYADMGHFGSRPIRAAWLAVAFPSLLLNYAGQAAIVLEGTPQDGNIFFRLCPGPLLVPLIILATVATIIASQAIITGTFSMTRQAIHLGWLPQLPIKQTSAEGYGQIYVGPVNWVLMVATIGLALGFRRSDNLASAYGIAVSLTMALTTVLLFFAMRDILRWPWLLAGLVALCLGVIDLGFVGANIVKIAEGGYVPLMIAGLIYGLMWIWHRGSKGVAIYLREHAPRLTDYAAGTLDKSVVRVPGSAVFLTKSGKATAPLLRWHVALNKALQEHVLVLTVSVAQVPFVPEADRLSVEQVAPDIWQAEATYGFMDDADIPALLDNARNKGCDLKLDDVTYYVGQANIVGREDGRGMPRWLRLLYALMQRNSVHLSDMLRLPRDRTVELGRQIGV